MNEQQNQSQHATRKQQYDDGNQDQPATNRFTTTVTSKARRLSWQRTVAIGKVCEPNSPLGHSIAQRWTDSDQPDEMAKAQALDQYGTDRSH